MMLPYNKAGLFALVLQQWTDGKEYPRYTLDTSSASHPVYTGKRREANTEGRASRFSDKFKGMASLVAKK